MTREPHGAMLSEEHFSASSKQRHPIVRNGPYPNDTQSLPWLNTHASLMLSLLLIGCAAGDPDISAQITAQFDATPSAPIDLRHIAGPDWERMCVLSPYTNNQRTAETLGLHGMQNEFPRLEPTTASLLWYSFTTMMSSLLPNTPGIKAILSEYNHLAWKGRVRDLIGSLGTLGFCSNHSTRLTV